MRTRNAQLEQDMRNVVSEVEELLNGVGKDSASAASDVRERVLEVLDGAKRRLAAIDEQVRSTARQAAYATDDYVHEKPWQAIGIGAAFGLLAGLLIARR